MGGGVKKEKTFRSSGGGDSKILGGKKSKSHAANYFFRQNFRRKGKRPERRRKKKKVRPPKKKSSKKIKPTLITPGDTSLKKNQKKGTGHPAETLDLNFAAAKGCKRGKKKHVFSVSKIEKLRENKGPRERAQELQDQAGLPAGGKGGRGMAREAISVSNKKFDALSKKGGRR